MPGNASEMALSSGETRPSSRSSRFIKGTMEPKPTNVSGSGLIAMLMHPLNVLLLAFPLGILSHLLSWGDVPTFWFNFVALVPLAKILGDGTEELAAGLKNDMLAGLLNATFGNAVEMVLVVQTIRNDHEDVAKATLLGSVLSNLLLVLGMAFFFGGIVSNSDKKKMVLSGTPSSASLGQRKSMAMRLTSVDVPETETYTEFVGEKVQTFSVMSALVNTSMLLLSCLSLSLVTVFNSETSSDGSAVMKDVLLPVSRICSIIIMIAYAAYVFFQLVTHREAMAEDDNGGGDSGDDEDPALSIPIAILVMLTTTCVVAFSSDLLVHSLKTVVEHSGINKHFFGMILLPIVGNACEHAAAIRFAIMDKCGLSIGIAVGSSTQMSLFVVPFSVMCGWFLGKDKMDLDFGILNTTVMSISVVVVLSVVVDGTANWLQGYLLMSAYFVVAVLYWYLPPTQDE